VFGTATWQPLKAPGRRLEHFLEDLTSPLLRSEPGLWWWPMTKTIEVCNKLRVATNS